MEYDLEVLFVVWGFVGVVSVYFRWWFGLGYFLVVVEVIEYCLVMFFLGYSVVVDVVLWEVEFGDGVVRIG